MRSLLRKKSKFVIRKQCANYLGDFLFSVDNFPLRAQLFTSLKADLRQDIYGGIAFIRCLNGTFPLRNCLVKTLVH